MAGWSWVNLSFDEGIIDTTTDAFVESSISSDFAEKKEIGRNQIRWAWDSHLVVTCSPLLVRLYTGNWNMKYSSGQHFCVSSRCLRQWLPAWQSFRDW